MKKLSQDDFLQKIIDKKDIVSVFLVNGIKLQGYIEKYDEHIVVIRRNYNDMQLVFKHAISTVIFVSAG